MAQVVTEADIALRLLKETEARAERLIEEARKKADMLIAEAKAKADQIVKSSLDLDEKEIEKIERKKLENEIEELRSRLKNKLEDLKKTISENREALIDELVKIILGYGDSYEY